MAKIDEEDFKFYKRQFDKDKTFHDTEVAKNFPEHVKMAYQGELHSIESGDHEHHLEDMMIENYLFIFANTALPSLFFQLPRFHIRSDIFEFQAAVIEALLNKDFNEKDKEENQLAIIDALLPYGYGVIKNGYNSRTGVKKKRNKIAQLFTGKQDTGGDKDNDMEADEEFIKFERSLGIRQSPKATYLDSTQPFGKGNRISFDYDRTLQQLIDSRLYKLSDNFIASFGAKAKDKREVELKLHEMFILIEGFAHKLVWVDGWQKELAFNKTRYRQLPASLLRFNKMGDILYNISHGKLGLAAQKELNYLNELWKKTIDNFRNQHLVHWDSLTAAGKSTMLANEIGGIVKSDVPLVQGVAIPLQSATPDANLFNNIANTREYLKLLLSVTGGKGGGPDSKLATTERNKALGDALRASGLQDAIRDFLVDQMKQRIKNILTLGSPKMILKLTGENLISPMTGLPIEAGTELEIGGEEGLELKDLITGDIDIDFFFDIDITSAQRPDFPVVRAQILQGAEFAATIEPKVNQEGKKIAWSKLLEDYYSTFDAVPDAKKYIQDMSQDEQKAFAQNLALQAQQEAEKGTKKTPTTAVPTETAIEGAAQTVSV